MTRNAERFPNDFAFRLNLTETRNLMLQIGTSSPEHGGKRKPARVFPEPGVAMLAGILHRHRAIAVSIAIVRTFVRLREFLSSQSDLAKKLSELENKVGMHDEAIADIFEAMRQLLTPDASESDRKIGFHRGNR